MKKTLIQLIALLLVFNYCNAQTAVPASLPVNGSYVVTSASVNVYPLVVGDSSPYYDHSTHFRLSAGTKFFVTKVIDSSTSKIGYVIKVWNFTKTDKNDKPKQVFYDSLFSARAKNLDIAVKVQLAKADTLKASKKVQELKKANADLSVAQKELASKKVVLADIQNNFANGEEEMAVFTPQNGNRLDPNNYKKTKADGAEIEGIKNKTSPYAIYDPLLYVDSWANDILFFMTAKDFSDNVVSIYPRSTKFTWGFLTLPIKMRFDNNRPGGHFAFEQNLNFGLSLGIKHQLVRASDVSWNYLGGISVVNVPLNNAVPATATAAAVPATSAAAISTSLGVMFQYDKFQFGVFAGKDFTGDNAYQFAYQGKTWLGFAIGISLFGEGKTTTDAQKNGNDE